MASREDFQEWKELHSKVYETEEEEERRLETWLGNMEKITQHNLLHDQKQASYRMAINHLGDMDDDEISNTMNRCIKMDEMEGSEDESDDGDDEDDESLPDHVDWRDSGYVTPVKNQGKYGTCYAFSTTGCLEGQWKRVTGDLVSFSEQNLVDCSEPQGNSGIHGGSAYYSFQYIQQSGGIDTEEAYPYQGPVGVCKYRNNNVSVVDIKTVKAKSEKALKKAVATQGPVSVLIDAHTSFNWYSSGVFDDPKPVKLDHAVLVVGYGTDEETGKDYWLVKNSWGTAWGEEGYIKMVRGKDNQRGIVNEAYYPIIR